MHEEEMIYLLTWKILHAVFLSLAESLLILLSALSLSLSLSLVFFSVYFSLVVTSIITPSLHWANDSSYEPKEKPVECPPDNKLQVLILRFHGNFNHLIAAENCCKPKPFCLISKILRIFLAQSILCLLVICYVMVMHGYSCRGCNVGNLVSVRSVCLYGSVRWILNGGYCCHMISRNA